MAGLWAGVVLSSLLISLAFQASVQKEWLIREMHEFAGHRNMLSGLRLAMEKETSIRVRLEDEEAKLNVNAADEFVILELLKVLKKKQGLEFVNDERKIAKGICAYRGQKSNGRYEFLEELLLTDQVGEEDFIKISPYLTVYAPGQALPAVNINTVSGVVLEALLNSVPGDLWRKKDLAERILESREACEKEENTCWQEEDLSPYAFSLKLGLPQSAEWMALLNHILPYLKTSSQTFRVFIMSEEEGKTAEAVIRERKDGSKREILDWQEA